VKSISKTAHTEVIDEAVGATCVTAGLTRGSHCDVCGTVIIAQEVVEATWHTTSDWIVDVKPDCTNEGVRHKICTVCETILEIEKIVAEGHTKVENEAVEATCLTTGLTKGSHCSVCNAIIEAQEVVDKLDHTPSDDYVVDVQADCVNSGRQHKYCTVCNMILETAEIKAFGHTAVVDQAVAPTCTAEGLTEGEHCSVCDTVLSVQVAVDMISHTPSDWIVDKESTVSEEGSRHKQCTVCGETLEQEVIARKEENSSGSGTNNSSDNNGGNSGSGSNTPAASGGTGCGSTTTNSGDGMIIGLTMAMIGIALIVRTRRKRTR
jgi:hypothetical protein